MVRAHSNVLFGVLAALLMAVTTTSACAGVKGKIDNIRADKNEKDEEGDEVAIKDLPKAVTDAVNAAVPGGTLKEAEKESKDGKVIFEVKTQLEKKRFEVKVDAEGKLISKKVDDDDEDDDDDDNDAKSAKKPVAPPAPPKSDF